MFLRAIIQNIYGYRFFFNEDILDYTSDKKET